jgi:Lamin Tail Domain
MEYPIFKPKLFKTCPFLLVFCLVLLRGGVFGQPISTAQPYDIIISEFMADPTPSRGLPEAEYIELYNRSNKTFDLKDYRIMNGKDTTLLKGDNSILKPNQYKIIYKKASDINFLKFGDTLQLSKMGSLTNSKDSFYLITNQTNVVIDAATYDLNLYQDSKKAVGGYSFERVNVNTPCNPLGWLASNNPNGGTPGKINSDSSKVVDNTPLEIDRYFFKNNDKIAIVFNKSLNRKGVVDKANYQLLSANYKIDSITIDNSILFNSIQLNFSPILKDSFRLIIKSSLKDCIDKTALEKPDTLLLKKTETPIRNDLIVNEILTNPETGGSRFIELYNNSNKVFDIANLRIGSDYTATNNTQITTKMLVFPKEYIVLTSNPFYIQKHYNATKFRKRILPQKLPAWDDKSDIVLLSYNNVTLDSFTYQKSWHNPLLANTEGVSLERVNPNNPSSDKSNWQSAAQTVGFATPAQQNSQFDTTNVATSNQIFTLEKKTFSPDGDGFEDFLSLNYRFDKGGFAASVFIFNDKGKLVKKLINNELLNVEGTIKWEGDTDEGLKIRMGIYVLFIEWISPTGQTEREKLACVVSGRL